MKALVLLAAILSVISCTAVAWFVFTHDRSGSKVCIVRMSVIMERYQGAIDASANVQRKQSAAQENIDSIIRSADVGADHAAASVRQQQVQRYIEVVEQKAIEEQAALSKRLMSHVKSAAETISDGMELDLVLAITDDSFVLSKSELVDVTDEVLRELKRSYRDDFKK